MKSNVSSKKILKIKIETEKQSKKKTEKINKIKI